MLPNPSHNSVIPAWMFSYGKVGIDPSQMETGVEEISGTGCAGETSGLTSGPILRLLCEAPLVARDERTH